MQVYLLFTLGNDPNDFYHGVVQGVFSNITAAKTACEDYQDSWIETWEVDDA